MIMIMRGRGGRGEPRRRRTSPSFPAEEEGAGVGCRRRRRCPSAPRYLGSPNPARHALGNEKGTPDSVIRPTVLTYRGEEVLTPRHRRRDEGGAEGDDGGPHHPPSLLSFSSAAAAAVAKEPFPDGKRPSPSAPDRTLRSATAGDDDDAPAELCEVRHPVDRRGGGGEGGSTEDEAGGDAPNDPPPRGRGVYSSANGHDASSVVSLLQCNTPGARALPRPSNRPSK